MLEDNTMEENIYYLRCDDYEECLVFHKFGKLFEGDTHLYEINIEDTYCGGDYKGIKGRFKRAWCAFWAKPISYTGIATSDTDKIKTFLTDCLKSIEEE